jgi:hypothetical protein
MMIKVKVEEFSSLSFRHCIGGGCQGIVSLISPQVVVMSPCTAHYAANSANAFAQSVQISQAARYTAQCGDISSLVCDPNIDM